MCLRPSNWAITITRADHPQGRDGRRIGICQWTGSVGQGRNVFVKNHFETIQALFSGPGCSGLRSRSGPASGVTADAPCTSLTHGRPAAACGPRCAASRPPPRTARSPALWSLCCSRRAGTSPLRSENPSRRLRPPRSRRPGARAGLLRFPIGWASKQGREAHPAGKQRGGGSWCKQDGGDAR